MTVYQIGYLLEEKKIDSIVAFLKTLNGDTPKEIKDINEKINN